jgi:hypothetical protein
MGGVHVVVDSTIEQIYECKWRAFIFAPQFDSQLVSHFCTFVIHAIWATTIHTCNVRFKIM